MRTIAFLVTLSMITLGSTAVAQQVISFPSNATCAQCGRVHQANHATATVSTPVTISQPVTVSSPTGSVSYAAPVQPVSYAAPVASSSSIRSSGGITNVLSTVNAQRSRQGVHRLLYDPALQAVAERRAQLMASTGLKNHPPGSFAPGRYEGVGWSSSYSPPGVSACYITDSRMRYAGAAMVTGRDGVYFAVVYR